MMINHYLYLHSLFSINPFISEENKKKIDKFFSYLKLITDLSKIIVEGSIPENKDNYFRDKIWTCQFIHWIGKYPKINNIAVN